jgi:sulfite exporter TauE/SafE
MLAVFLGCGTGILHVLSGPDHLAAVAPLAQEKRHSWTMGFLWGVGHTSGFCLVGVLALLMRHLVDWDLMRTWGDGLASLGLVGLGLWGLGRVLASGVERRKQSVEAGLGQGRDVRPHLACVLGSLHGLAGSSHYLGALPALAFSSSVSGVAYLAGFGAGTIVTMVAFSWGWGKLLGRAVPRGEGLGRALRLGCAGAALGLGAWYLIG